METVTLRYIFDLSNNKQTKNLKIMTTAFKQTKTKTYIRFGSDIYKTNKDYSNKTLELVDLNVLNSQQVAAITSDYNWTTLEECDTIETAYDMAIIHMQAIGASRRAANEELAQQIADRKAKEWASISSLDVIPATPENIRILLEHLNGQNWGGWKLPKMSLTYSAAQYDCDGSLASTIVLDKAIDLDGRKVKKFKVGGKHGHLNQYQSL